MFENYLKSSRSEGDNLLGFIIDLEYFLEDIEGMSSVAVHSTDDGACMLIANCSFNRDIGEDVLAKKLKQTWTEYLRYSEFEIHKTEISNGKVIFHFCTKSGPLGVTGKVVAHGT